MKKAMKKKPAAKSKMNSKICSCGSGKASEGCCSAKSCCGNC